MPFPVLAGLGEVVRHPGWVQAMAAVRAGLDAGGPVVLTGLPGLGKSLLLQALAHALDEEGQTVVLLPGEPLAQDRRPDVVLLDEADRVPPALLRHLVGHAGRCVLAGSRELLGTLGELNHAPRLVEMRPLLPHEVGPYLLEQVERADLPDTLLGPGTLQALARLGHGNPRRLQKLASRALFRAWIDDADQVSTTHVADALVQDGPAAVLAAAEPSAEPAPAPPSVVAPVAAPVAAPAAAPFPPMLSGLPLVPVPGGRAGGRADGRTGPPASHRFRPWMAAAALAFCAAGVGAVLAPWHGGPVPVAGPASPPVWPSPPPTELAASAPAPVQPPDAAPEPRTDTASGPAPAGLAPEPPAQDLATLLPEAAVPSPPVVAEVPAPAAPEPFEPPAAVPPVAVPVAPAPPLPRPAAAPVHVVVTFAPSDAAAGSRSVSLVGTLRDAGLESVLAIGAAPDRGASVRYYFPADQAAAALVARRVGEPGRERLTALPGAMPRPGTVQVVISSRSGGHRPARATRPSEEKNTL